MAFQVIAVFCSVAILVTVVMRERNNRGNLVELFLVWIAVAVLTYYYGDWAVEEILDPIWDRVVSIYESIRNR